MMKLLLRIAMALFMAIMITGYAYAGETTFTYAPSVPDLDDLDHIRYYKWEVDLASQGWTPDMTITEAYLKFEDITNWDNRYNVLYLHLIDIDQMTTSESMNFITGIDWQYGPIGNPPGNTDNFYNQGLLLDEWHDTNGSYLTNDLTYTFSQINDNGENALDALIEFGQDGYVSFGIDPDCHYWNKGITFELVTTKMPPPTIPAPSALILGALGISSVVRLRRRKLKNL